MGNDVVFAANKEALDKLVNLLKAQPSQILPVLQLVRSGKVVQAVSDQVKAPEDEVWPPTCIRLVKLPKYYRTAVVEEQAQKMDKQHFAHLDSETPKVLSDMLVFPTGIKESWHFPPGTKDKRVCTQVFAKQIAALNRMPALESHVIGSKTGLIDWGSFGVYSIVAKDGEDRVARIRHISGVEVFVVLGLGRGVGQIVMVLGGDKFGQGCCTSPGS